MPDLANLTESVTNFTDGTFGNITFDETFSDLTESLNVTMNATELLHNATDIRNKTELLMEAAGNATEFLANSTSKIEELMPNMTDALIDLESSLMNMTGNMTFEEAQLLITNMTGNLTLNQMMALNATMNLEATIMDELMNMTDLFSN